MNATNTDKMRANIKYSLECELQKNYNCRVICDTSNNSKDIINNCIGIATVIWIDTTTKTDVLVFGMSNDVHTELIFGTPEQIAKTQLLTQE